MNNLEKKPKAEEKLNFSSNIFKLGTGTAIGQLLVAGATPIITRLYNPSEIGLSGLFMSFIMFLSVGVTLRYDMAIVSVKDNREAECLLVISLLLVVPVSILSGFILFLMIKNNFMSYGLLPTWSPALAIILLCLIGIFISLRYWFVRENDYKGIRQALIFQGLGRATFPIILSFLHLGWLGLVASEIISRMAGIGKLILKVTPTINGILKPFYLEKFRNTFKQNWRSPTIILPSSLINSLSGILPVPLIALLFGIEASGQYFLVQQLTALPAGLIVTSVADVFHPVIANAHWNSPEDVRPILLNVVRKLMFYSILIYLPIMMVSPFIFANIFGRSWNEAGIMLTIIAPIYMVGLVVSPLGRLLLVVNRGGMKLIYDFMSLSAPIIGLFIMHHFKYSFFPSLMLYSVIQVFSYLIYFYLIWHVSGMRS